MTTDSDLGAGADKPLAGNEPLVAELPERGRFTPTYHLIRLHHMRSGATKWSREKYRRLCVAFNETEEEMGMRIGLAPAAVRHRMLGGKFTVTEGILLQLHWNFIQSSRTGVEPDGPALAPKNAEHGHRRRPRPHG